jgi:hypothetical protein
MFHQFKKNKYLFNYPSIEMNLVHPELSEHLLVFNYIPKGKRYKLASPESE